MNPNIKTRMSKVAPKAAMSIGVGTGLIVGYDKNNDHHTSLQSSSFKLKENSKYGHTENNMKSRSQIAQKNMNDTVTKIGLSPQEQTTAPEIDMQKIYLIGSSAEMRFK